MSLGYSKHIGIVTAVFLHSFLGSYAFSADKTESISTNALSKVQKTVIDAIASGNRMNVIVEIKSQDINKSVANIRATQGLRKNSNSILSLMKGQFSQRKAAIFDPLRKSGIRVRKDFNALPMSVVEIMNANSLQTLINNPQVVAVYENEIHEANLIQSLALINQPQAALRGNIGQGTTVAVLDTGVDMARVAFGSCTAPGQPAGCRVVFAQDFAPQDNSFDADPSLHGTNVAGIVLGVSPGTQIAALDVFNGNGASSVDIIAAINWSINNQQRFNIVAINLSLGVQLSKNQSVCNSWATTPFRQARAAGIAPVVAAGNDGFTDGISSPACTMGAISVGSVIDTGTRQDQVSSFSNSGSLLTLLAPGENINAAGINLRGTSQAAPHVAGAVAVLRAADTFPNENVNETIIRLTSSGVLNTDTRNGKIIVRPRLNLTGALDYVVDIASFGTVTSLTNQSGMSPNHWAGNYRILHPGDYNGDGFVDALLQGVNNQHDTFILYGGVSGFGSVQALTNLYGMSSNHWAANYRKLYTEDYDGDGIDDLLLQGVNNQHDTFILYGGVNGFSSVQSLTNLYAMSANHWAGNYRRLFSGDYNNDGMRDLLLQGVNNQHDTFILYGSTTGFNNVQSLTNALGMSSNHWAGNYRSLYSGDFNGDNKLDILLQGVNNQHDTFILYGSASGLTNVQSLTNKFGMSPNHWAGNYRKFYSGDFNGDNIQDVLLQGVNNQHDTFILYGRTNGFTDVQVITNLSGMSLNHWAANWRILHPADYNGDGFQDVLLQGASNAHDTFYLYGGPNGLSHVQSLTGSFGMSPNHWAANYRKLFPRDYNGDGQVDLLMQGANNQHDTFQLRGVN